MKQHPSVQQFDIERVLRTLILIAVALAIVLSMTGCSTTACRQMLGKDNKFDREVAGQMLPGHYGYRKCEPYAVALSEALTAKGIVNRKLAYEWVAPDGTRDLHAVVLFEKDGAYWMMDNMRDTPKRVTGKTDLELCQKFGLHVKRMQNWVTAAWEQPQDVETLLHPPVLKHLTRAGSR